MRKAIIVVWILLTILTITFAVDATAQTVRVCELRASGDACIFDLSAVAGGRLKVDTRAGAAGDFWRTTVVEVGQTRAKTNIGDGSDAAFSGSVARHVSGGRTYEAIITYELGSTEIFPTTVEVRFVGPVEIYGPRPIFAEPIYVAEPADGGSDTNPGTRSMPFATIQKGINEAETRDADVYVAAGTYTPANTLLLANGVSIIGGFDVADWVQRGNETVVNVAQPIAVFAQEIGRNTVLDTLTLTSVNASAGASSYGIYAEASDGLVVLNSRITAGNGGPGVDGNSQPGAPGGMGGGGTNGSCDGGNGFGGLGGSSVCGANGGSGGDGGAPGPNDGESGYDGRAVAGGGAPGLGGNGGQYGDCGDFGTNCPGDPGELGASGKDGSPGQNGQGATNALGTVVSGFWEGESGTDGAGTPGGGGGGGGGGGAQTGYMVDDGGGNGGGGGGGGGCGGVGTGGTAGGGSFGIFLVDCTDVQLEGNTVTSKDGGNGGAGGDGGAAAPGGAGGAGGLGATACTGEIGAGGNGGNGGSGGDGGDGGGGAGGVSFAIGFSNSTIIESGNTFLYGSGGAGGSSLGNPGIAGASGSIQNF